LAIYIFGKTYLSCEKLKQYGDELKNLECSNETANEKENLIRVFKKMEDVCVNLQQNKAE